MPTGERPPRRQRPRGRPARGFTYLLLLFGVALLGAGVARLGPQWQVAAQREREVELLFRGAQIRDALQRFHDQTPQGAAALPTRLEDLLVDRRRVGQPRHHLRRLYADPFTGQADWLLLRDEQGGILGVRSRSTQRALLQRGTPRRLPAPIPDAASAPEASAQGIRLPVGSPDDTHRVGDWEFAIQPRRSPLRRSA